MTIHTGPGFTEPIFINGEPWRYVLIPERTLHAVYTLASRDTAGNLTAELAHSLSDPLLREIHDLEDQRRSTSDTAERNRLSSRISYRRRKLRDREEL